MTRSLMEEISLLEPDLQTRMLDGMDPDKLVWDWKSWGRPEQFAPPGSWKVWMICAGRGFGKPFTLNTNISTPDGWMEIQYLREGDRVFAHDGTVCRVTKTQDRSSEHVYRVTFDDGSILDAGKNHEWNVFRGKTRSYYAAERDLRQHHSDWWEWSFQPQNSGRKHIRVPEEILTRAKELRVDGASWRHVERTLKSEFPDAQTMATDRSRLAKILEGSGVHDTSVKRYDARTALLVETHELRPGDAIPVAEPLDLPEADLPIDPYVLGLWLGDGSKSDGSVCAGRDDWEFVSRKIEEVYSDARTKQVRQEPYALWNSTSRTLRAELDANNLLFNKHVPDLYFRASREQRLELLRGLMDTDGHVNKDGIHAGVGFVLQNLADAVYELVVSLGMIARRRIKMLPATDLKPERPFYGVEFRPSPDLNPFKLSRKANRVTEIPRDQASRKTMRRVKSVEYVGVQDTRCIAIDHRSQLFLAGEAMIPTHNTRAGAEWVREKARIHPGCRIALVGRTAADVRDVMVDGESGIVSVTPDGEKPVFQASRRRLVWPNGSEALMFSSEEPSQLRGPQFHYAWADEAAAWKFTVDDSGLNAWGNLRFAVRLGNNPQTIATTTPKRTPFMHEILEEHAKKPKMVVVTRGSTYDNLTNLDEGYLDFVTDMYAGTRIEQQELMGLMLDAFDGALFSETMIDDARLNMVNAVLPLRVVAVDPSVAENPTDECGIMVIGATNHRQMHKRHAYILEDATVHGSPDKWVKEVIRQSKKWNAPVIAEKNQGHALIDLAIHAQDPSIDIYAVHSKVGKQLRAEPVALAYEQKRVHHIGHLAELESQMTNWLPGETRKSPDRLDALVHGVTALLIQHPKDFQSGPMRAHSVAGRKISGGKGAGFGRQVAGSRGRRAA